jgi:NitT/TauT family transport system substrate-binding protein
MPIVLQEPFRAVFYAPYYAAFARDAYGREGVDVTLGTAAGPAALPQALASGAADVAWGGPMRVLLTYDRDPACDLVCFCEAVTRDPFFILGRTPRPDFALTDLRGLRVATVSEVPTPWMCLQEDLRRAGTEPATLDRVHDRGMAENAAALARGDIDAVQLFEPFVTDVLESGAGHVWYAAANRGPTSYTCFYARRPVLAARGDELRRMTRAMAGTLAWLASADAATVAARIADYFPDLPAPRLAAAIARYQALGVWGKDPVLPQAGFERLKAGLLSGGLIRRDTPFAIAVDNSLAEGVPSSAE